MDIPLDYLPELAAREGLRFSGVIRAGKAHISIPESDVPGLAATASSDAKRRAVEHFFTAWSGKALRLTQDEIDQDPRLAYLTAKHIH